MKKITPFLWFDTQALEAANFYVSLFNNSKILETTDYEETAPGTEDVDVLVVKFVLDGQEFFAMNAGPIFKFNESISMYVDCKDQAEVDRLWEALSEGGEVQQCGWLKDKYGLSWQIVPSEYVALQSDPDPVKAKRVRDAMLKMVKIDVAGLRKAYAGE
jgi:predicted 3-demethylubiquinone-9 3-methyltransferase (glyoxalase superfamily)